MNLVNTVTQDELFDLLLNIAPVRPVFIWGAPGIGKSALVEKFADEVGLPCVSLLARWFDCNFPLIEKRYTYARPSRRQGATPDIPRPSYTGMTVDLKVHHEHAYLIPKGRRLPFKVKGEVFLFEEFCISLCRTLSRTVNN